jgi:hypothetical protein
MTPEAANIRITVFRGTTTNAFGDVISTSTPFAEHVPAILVETGRSV